MNNINNKVYLFNTREEADDALCKIKTTADDYSFISVADTNYICGLVSIYADNKIGWLKHTIDNICVTREMNCWSIVLPRPLPIGEEKPRVRYREYSAVKKPTITKPTPEPLYITIHTKEVDDVDTALTEIFSHICTVKDRVINLTIM